MFKTSKSIIIYFSIVAVLVGLVLGYLRFGFLDSVSKSSYFTVDELRRARFRLNLVSVIYLVGWMGLFVFYVQSKKIRKEERLKRFRPILTLLFGVVIILIALVVLIPLYSYPSF